jgi:hypothetical protein
MAMHQGERRPHKRGETELRRTLSREPRIPRLSSGLAQTRELNTRKL